MHAQVIPLPESEFPDERALVERVQGGEVDAFEPLVDRHLPMLRAFIALKAPFSHLVDELAHEAFVWAFHHIGEFTPGTSLKAWLRAIAANLLRAEFRRMGREHENLSRYQQARLIELERQTRDTPDADEAEALHECWQRVPEDMRRLLEMKYRDGSDTGAMAQTFSRSLEWVRVTLFRLRAQLRDCIGRRLGKEAAC
jgi:RNA polymerase sigma-70 factor (ECF subfamily)